MGIAPWRGSWRVFEMISHRAQGHAFTKRGFLVVCPEQEQTNPRTVMQDLLPFSRPATFLRLPLPQAAPAVRGGLGKRRKFLGTCGFLHEAQKPRTASLGQEVKRSSGNDPPSAIGPAAHRLVGFGWFGQARQWSLQCWRQSRGPGAPRCFFGEGRVRKENIWDVLSRLTLRIRLSSGHHWWDTMGQDQSLKLSLAWSIFRTDLK